MVITLVDTMMALQIGATIISKAVLAAKEGKAVDLTQEISALEKNRLAPSEDIIGQADKAMGKG